MSPLALLLLAATSSAAARIDSVNLTTVDSQLAVRVALSGQPGMVAVHREGEGARISISGAELGGSFAGGTRFAWTPTNGFDPGLLSSPTRLDRIEVAATAREVSVILRVPPETSIDVKRYRRGLLLILREASSPGPTNVAMAEPPPVAAPQAEPPEPTMPLGPETGTEPVGSTPVGAASGESTAPAATPELAPESPQSDAPSADTVALAQGLFPEAAAPSGESTAPAATPEPAPESPESDAPSADTVALAQDLFPEAAAPSGESTAPAATPEPAPESPQSDAPSADTVALAQGLFPEASAAAVPAGSTGEKSIDELYAQLFAGGAPRTEPEVVEPAAEMMAPGVPFGPFRVRGGVDARYVDADTFVAGPQSATQDRFLEVTPRLLAEAPVSEGHFDIQYTPSIRAFATFEEINSTSHRLRGELALPIGPSVELSLRDYFVSGTLESREVDPGGEYFFGLGQFRRNSIDGSASVVLGQRTSLELRGTVSSLRFVEPSSFFDHDRRLVSAGLGYELNPNLKTILWYQYDRVPTPAERPEAESTAHNAQVTFTGDLLPLLSGQLMVGYRDQRTPNAGAGGTHYRGFTMSGSLTKQFSRESSATLFLTRSTPVSAFEENAYYVFTAIQGSGRIPLPLGLQLQGGMGYQWNDYKTPSAELGVPRADRILAWYLGLRRAIRQGLHLSATYRREDRTSNLEAFNTEAEGFVLQLEWDIFGNTP